jgi:hypothetical protein
MMNASLLDVVIRRGAAAVVAAAAAAAAAAFIDNPVERRNPRNISLLYSLLAWSNAILFAFQTSRFLATDDAWG